jgi:hypothetical protein
LQESIARTSSFILKVEEDEVEELVISFVLTEENVEREWEETQEWVRVVKKYCLMYDFINSKTMS